MTLSGANTYTGATTISSGTLLVGAANAISSTSDVTDNATLDLNGFSDTIGALAGSGTVTSSAAGAVTLTVGATNDSGTFSGVIQNGSGVVALTKAGTGTETLSGANTYTGGTNINAGSLTISNGSGLGTGALTVNETTGATFLTVANNNAVTLANNIILAAPGSAQTYTLVKNSASASTGTALSLTGNISGGNGNATLYLNTNTTGDDTTSFDFAGNNTFQAAEVDLNRGIIVVGSATGLGNAANLIYLNANDNTTKGDLQFAVGGTFANPIDFAYARKHQPTCQHRRPDREPVWFGRVPGNRFGRRRNRDARTYRSQQHEFGPDHHPVRCHAPGRHRRHDGQPRFGQRHRQRCPGVRSLQQCRRQQCDQRQRHIDIDEHHGEREPKRRHHRADANRQRRHRRHADQRRQHGQQLLGDQQH